MALTLIHAYAVTFWAKVRRANAHRTAVDLLGLAVIAFGIAMLSIPAGVIFAGAGVCFVNYATPEATAESTGDAT